MAVLALSVMLVAGCASQLGRDQDLQTLPDRLPSASFPDHFKVDPYIAAAQQLQKMGRKAAARQLMEWADGWAITLGRRPLQRLAAPGEQRWQSSPSTEVSMPKKLSIDDEVKIYVLCRMLFVARPGSRFDPPFFGDPAFMGIHGPTRPLTNGFGSFDFPLWPLCPIEIVDGVPFLITQGYVREGFIDPIEVEMYVKYCLKYCDWSPVQFSPKTGEQKTAAMEKLLASPNFRGAHAREYLRAEIE